MDNQNNPIKTEQVLEQIAHNNESDLCASSGERLKAARIEAGYTQYGLALLVRQRGLRCSTNYIGQLERGSRNMSERLAHCFGRILNVRPDYLLGRDSIKNTEDFLDAVIEYAFEDHRTDEQKRHDKRLNNLSLIISENSGLDIFGKFNSNIPTDDQSLYVEFSTSSGSINGYVPFKDVENFVTHIANVIRFESEEFARMHLKQQ